MNIEHLQLFVRISQTSNISRAGKELGLSAAVASSYISKLETRLGVRLIHRTTRKVSLTEEGKAFLPHAEDVLASVEGARSSVGVGQTSPRGTLRIAAPASFGRLHLVPALNGFFALYPNLRIDLKLSDTIVDLVAGGFDIAIRNSALKDSSLVARKLAIDHRIVCASPSYLAQHGTPDTPKSLGNHQCLTLIGLDHWTFQMGKEQQTIKAQGVFRTDNGEAIRDASLNGLGITLSSTWNAYQYLKSGELVQILENYPLVSDTAIWALYPSTRQLAPKIRAFIDYFAEHFGSPPFWDKEIKRPQK